MQNEPHEDQAPEEDAEVVHVIEDDEAEQQRKQELENALRQQAEES